MVFEYRNSFLENEVVGVDYYFALFGQERDMEEFDVFYFAYDGKIFVVYFDDIAYFEGEREKQNDARGNIAQYRPLRHHGHTHNGGDWGYCYKNIFGLHAPNEYKT